MTFWKKTLLLILTLLMLCSLAACEKAQPEDTKPTLNPGDPGCNHSWTEWDVTREATCSRNGRQKRSCETCGKEEQETILAWGHIYTDGQCIDCQKEAKTCDHEEVYELVMSVADCDSDGEARVICKKCKAVVEQNITSAYWHPEWDVVKISEPTCDQNGIEHLVCKLCQEIIGQNVLDANGHDYLYVDGQDPTCTEDGWTCYERCRVCDEVSGYEILPATGHIYVAGTCPDCGLVDPDFEVMEVSRFKGEQLVVSQSVLKGFDVPPARVDHFSGEIANSYEKYSWPLSAPVDGKYFIWVNKMKAGRYVQAQVLDSDGQVLFHADCLYGNGGIHIELEAGEYTINVFYGDGKTGYGLHIGYPKEPVDISGYAVIRDQMQYFFQSITYTYTPEASGVYYFSLSDFVNYGEVYMQVQDSDGQVLDVRYNATNGTSIMLELEAGKTYSIYLESNSCISPFALTISTKRAVLDVTGYASIVDCHTYNQQQLTYSFVASDSRYTFALQDMTVDNATMRIFLYGPSGELLYRSDWCPNDSSFSMDAFEVGQSYTIVVEQSTHLTEFTLHLLTPAEPVEIPSGIGVRDEMLYIGQVNTYRYTVESAQPHWIMLDVHTDLAYCGVMVDVYDAEGNWVGGCYLMDGEGIELDCLEVGQTYTICITQNSVLGAYTFCLQG